MRFQYRYYGATSVDNGAASTTMRFAPDTLRPPTYFVADVNEWLQEQREDVTGRAPEGR